MDHESKQRVLKTRNKSRKKDSKYQIYLKSEDI